MPAAIEARRAYVQSHPSHFTTSQRTHLRHA